MSTSLAPVHIGKPELRRLGREIAADVRGIQEAVANMVGVQELDQRGPHDRLHAQSGADEWRLLSCWSTCGEVAMGRCHVSRDSVAGVADAMPPILGLD